jgi:2-oxoglutarate dehydrogenase complex dehydrogenase (E1) component-like enzyme
VASTPRELAEGRFQTTIDDDEARTRVSDVRRVIACSGKVYVDLGAAIAGPRRATSRSARVEQLYPVPAKSLRAMLDQYSNADEVVWMQEEPENMAPGTSSVRTLQEAADGRPVRVIARPRSASPAEGIRRAPRAPAAPADRGGVRGLEERRPRQAGHEADAGAGRGVKLGIDSVRESECPQTS